MANAYSDLQAALNDAVSNDQIWVAAGTYTPTDDYGLGLGSRGQHFRMINGVAICGGFAGTETALGQRDIQAKTSMAMMAPVLRITLRTATTSFTIHWKPNSTRRPFWMALPLPAEILMMLIIGHTIPAAGCTTNIATPRWPTAPSSVIPHSMAAG
jgi:hypothetical protein